MLHCFITITLINKVTLNPTTSSANVVNDSILIPQKSLIDSDQWPIWLHVELNIYETLDGAVVHLYQKELSNKAVASSSACGRHNRLKDLQSFLLFVLVILIILWLLFCDWQVSLLLLPVSWSLCRSGVLSLWSAVPKRATIQSFHYYPFL